MFLLYHSHGFSGKYLLDMVREVGHCWMMQEVDPFGQMPQEDLARLLDSKLSLVHP